jgi:hypothetical protein
MGRVFSKRIISATKSAVREQGVSFMSTLKTAKTISTAVYLIGIVIFMILAYLVLFGASLLRDALGCAAMIRLAKKIGYVEARRKEKFHELGGQWHDNVTFSTSKEYFKNIQINLLT